MEPIINSQVPEFKVQAFHNGEFKTVTNKDIEGKWAIFFFYPADFTFVCPTELVDIAEKYNPTHKSIFYIVKNRLFQNIEVSFASDFFASSYFVFCHLQCISH